MSKKQVKTKTGSLTELVNAKYIKETDIPHIILNFDPKECYICHRSEKEFIQKIEKEPVKILNFGQLYKEHIHYYKNSGGKIVDLRQWGKFDYDDPNLIEDLEKDEFKDLVYVVVNNDKKLYVFPKKKSSFVKRYTSEECYKTKECRKITINLSLCEICRFFQFQINDEINDVYSHLYHD